jgi:hypothetical protein
MPVPAYPVTSAPAAAAAAAGAAAAPSPAAALARAAAALRARTGGPDDDGPQLLEHVLGWVLVVAVAVLVTRLGLL